MDRPTEGEERVTEHSDSSAPAGAGAGGDRAAGAEPAQDPRKIRAMFDLVAPRYDQLNDIMSFGIHRGWKKTMRRRAGKPSGRGLALDVAGGTGDVASTLAETGWSVVVLDPSEGMMREGRDRNFGPRVRWVGGDGTAIPFPDATFDLVTIAFGLRNILDRRAALAEARRVLVPGGAFLCLEFSTPNRLIRGPYRAYSSRMIPRVGAAVSGQPAAYQYLVDSIAAFPDQKTLAVWMTEAGFNDVSWRNLSFGIAALHRGRRPADKP